MQGPSAIALRQGGQGGALKYKLGVQVICRIASGHATPPSWKKKTTLQEAFGDFGQVLEIHTQDDGTAIIEYEDARDAEDAAQTMNGKKVGGAVVSVQIRQEQGTGRGVRGGVDDRVTEMASKYGLDATSTARLVSAFRDRTRRGCNLDSDIKELSEHLANSNKPSALVCMKLSELREGKPIGPCRYTGGGPPPREGREPAAEEAVLPVQRAGARAAPASLQEGKEERKRDRGERRPRSPRRSRSARRDKDRERHRERSRSRDRARR